MYLCDPKKHLKRLSNPFPKCWARVSTLTWCFLNRMFLSPKLKVFSCASSLFCLVDYCTIHGLFFLTVVCTESPWPCSVVLSLYWPHGAWALTAWRWVSSTLLEDVPLLEEKGHRSPSMVVEEWQKLLETQSFLSFMKVYIKYNQFTIMRFLLRIKMPLKHIGLYSENYG